MMSGLIRCSWRLRRALPLGAFARDARGTAAVEFALVAPFLLYLYFGGVELLEGIGINQQVAQTATTVATVVTQYTTISASTQMPDILNAATQIMSPNPVANATVVVSCITISASGQATVSWSQTLNGTARPTGQVVSVPTLLDVPNTTVILSEATYTYKPNIDFINMGTKRMYSSVFMVPRDATTINLVA
jgi:Flp pilus assembly protein TadG